LGKKFRKKYFLNFLFLIAFGCIFYSRADEITPENTAKWRLEKKVFNNSNWEILSKEEQLELFNIDSNSKNNYENKFKFIPKNYAVKAIGKGLVINNKIYPNISNYVPNAFVEYWEKNITLNLRYINKTRSCPEYSLDCADALLETDINIFNTLDKSLNLKWAMQSLSSRNNGTNFGEGNSFGFKAAKQINPKFSIAIGGDHIVHMDKTIDLGRNFYFVGSKFYPLSINKSKSFLIMTAGIGSDFFGYRGNGYIGKTSCFGKPNLTGNGENKCSWGPIGSASLIFNENFALVNEWFGYGFGTGISIKPFKNYPVNFSIYATDYLGNFPDYISSSCKEGKCGTRFYGGISISF